MFQLNDWFIKVRRHVLPKICDKNQYQPNRRRKIKSPVEDGSNGNILQNNP